MQVGLISLNVFIWSSLLMISWWTISDSYVVVSKDGVDNQMETQDICVICHMEFEHEETAGKLGCGHEYHTGCIKQWLLKK